MLKNIINTISSRHFWRTASFSEMGQLHVARLVRTIAINLGAGLIAVYMYKIGYSLVFISLFWVAYFMLKVVIMLPLAQLIASIGPRKSIIISNFLYVPSMIAFMFVEQYGMPMLVITVIFQTSSAALYDMGYLVGLSRLSRDSSKGGRAVAMMKIAETVAKGLSPLIGGILAMMFDPRASIVVSLLFFVLASLPLIKMVDSMKTGFRLAPRGFGWRGAAQSLLVQIPIGFDYYASTTAWSLFLVVLIFASGGNEVYAKLGALTSLILVVSLVSAYAYGKLIDKKAGGQLLVWTAIGSVVSNLFRVFVRTPIAAIGTNAAHEMMATGYSMAYTRGMMDTANQTGYRVFYIAMTQLASNLGAGLAALVMAVIIALLGDTAGFSAFYLVTSIIVIGIAFVRFSVYKKA